MAAMPKDAEDSDVEIFQVSSKTEPGVLFKRHRPPVEETCDERNRYLDVTVAQNIRRFVFIFLLVPKQTRPSSGSRFSA